MAYYSRQIKADLGIDEESLKPFFPMDRVVPAAIRALGEDVLGFSVDGPLADSARVAKLGALLKATMAKKQKCLVAAENGNGAAMPVGEREERRMSKEAILPMDGAKEEASGTPGGGGDDDDEGPQGPAARALEIISKPIAKAMAMAEAVAVVAGTVARMVTEVGVAMVAAAAVVAAAA